jgi:hypothetical protein
MHIRSRRLVAGFLAAGIALAPAGAAWAGPSSVDAAALATVTVGNLILEPTGRGYTGTLPTSVTYNGTEPGWLDLVIIEPVPGAWKSALNSDACLWNTAADGRRLWECSIGTFAPGETRDVTSTLRVLTKTRKYAMSVADADIYVTSSQGTASTIKQYSTRFRGTDGSLRNPRPYVQDTQSDATVRIGTSARMVQQEGGYFLGRVPVTVKWKGDAAHWFVNVDAALPDGWIVWDTDPASGYPCAGGCSVPAADGTTELMQGEVSAFDLIIYAPEGTVPGSYGPITATATAYFIDGPLTDVTPADNSGTFTAVL